MAAENCKVLNSFSARVFISGFSSLTGGDLGKVLKT